MAGRERGTDVVCPRCTTSQPVPIDAVAHECARCSWEWRFAICGTCDTVACTLEYLESWQCRSCRSFNRSWWKTADAEREAVVVSERRRADNATHRWRWVAAAGAVLAALVASVWFVVPRQSPEQREQAAAGTVCRHFDQLRRDEASGTLSRAALLREVDSLGEEAASAPAAVRAATSELAGAAVTGTDSPRFAAAMTSVAEACRVAGIESGG